MLILMPSDSDLKLFTFRSEKKIGHRIQSDTAKSNPMGHNMILESDGPKSDDSARRILESKNGIGLFIKYNLTEQSLVQQQYEVHTDVRVAIDALDYECNHDAQTQSSRLSAASLQLAVGRRGLGARDQEEQRTQRASFVATYHTRANSPAAVGHHAGLGCSTEKYTT